MPGTRAPRPALKPWYRLLHDENRLLLQYGETVVSFEGRAVRRLLPALLPLLDGTRTVAEIVQIVGPPVQRAVEQALALLDQNGLLTEADTAAFAESERRSAEFLAAIDPGGRSPAALLAAVRAARVLVVGSGSLALEVASSLRRSGVCDLEQLPLGAPRYELGEVQLAVAAPEGEELPSLREWNEAALAAGLPWLQVLPFDGAFCAVGPLYMPGETGCFECFRIRRASNVDCGRDFLALHEVPVRLPASASLEQTVAGLAATIALRWLAHRDQFLPGTWYALEPALQPALGTHVLYRVPRCPSCSGLDAIAQPLPWHRAEARRVMSTSRLRTLVSPYTGVVRRVDELLGAPDEIRLVAVSCETADLGVTLGGPSRRVGSGSGSTRESAFAASLGEAVERYSASCPPERDDLVVGCALELGDQAVDPARFALFSGEQYGDPRFPYVAFTGATHVIWTRGWALPGGGPALLPAQLVYLSDAYGHEPVRVASSTSNGLACHATPEEAVLRGLLELVERDAFMIVWSNRLSLPRLSWAGDEELRAFEAGYLAPTGLRYAALDLSCFWDVPTALGVVRSCGAATGALGVGACAARTIQVAVRKALDEACRVQAWASDLLAREPEREFEPDASDVRDFDDHVQYYADRDRARAADFLDTCPETRDVGEVEPLPGASATELIETVAGRLDARGSSAYAADVTSPDIRAAGLTVARVVAPELCALDSDHRARFLGGRRRYDAAFELGLSSRPLEPADLNPFPHPFP